jgi:4-amino-4-deoxy-L-arabinose transferase-like glycosyltransferase
MEPPSRYRLAVWALLTAFLVLALASVREKTLTYDEPDHLRYGLQILHGDADRFDDSKMPVSALNALPWRLAEALPEGRVRAALSGVFAARVPTILAALLLGLLVHRWARELYGDGAGLFALALFVLDPNLLAHSRWATTDLYAALGATAAFYFFWRFQQEGGWRPAGWAALALSGAQIAKYSSLFLAPLLVVLAGIRHWKEIVRAVAERNPWRGKRLLTGALRYGALFALVAVLVVNAGFLFRKSFTPLEDYPFRTETFSGLQQALPGWLPVPVPYPYLEGLDWVRHGERTGVWRGSNYLWGELRSPEGFKSYYLVAYLFKVPLALQALFVAACIRYWRRRRDFRFAENEAFLLVPVLFFFVYLNLFFQAQMGIRYLLVAFPLMHVFTASLLAPAGPGGRIATRGRLAIGALLVWAAVSVLSYYPHFLSYFNELVWDRKMAYRVLSDSNLEWGKNERFLERWLEEHPEAIVEPDGPVAGTVVVRVNYLTGVLRQRQFRWLRNWLDEPVGHVAYSYLVYEITPEDLERLPPHLRPEVPSPAPP